MLKVVKAQGQGLVSDCGRWGYQHEGVPVGGVLDRFSFAVGNQALGNAENAACLELMGQFDFVCAKPCRVLLANRGAQALLNGRPVLCGQVVHLQEGDLLRTLAPFLGFWNMLCVQGGVDVPLVMGSRSTCAAAGFGGYQGRALQVGDELHAGEIQNNSLRFRGRLAMPLALREEAEALTVHCLAGPEFEALTSHSQTMFSTQIYAMGIQSSRMGYRLEGVHEKLALKQALSLRSRAVHPGIVQLPPSGQPFVLLSEAQVTGGYPRVASVLSCELWKFAQLGSGQGVHWVIVDLSFAKKLQIKHDKEREIYRHVIQ